MAMPRRAILFSIAVAVSSSCGGGGLALPSESAGVLEVVAGQRQSGVVGAPLPDSLVVRVTDATGAGIPGVPVQWSASGGGAVSPASSVTDVDGLAATERMLGDVPGAYATTVTAPVTEGSPTVFLATAGADLPDADDSKVDASPKTLTASTGGSEAVVTVTVRDRRGNPVSGMAVTLSATGSGNALTQPAQPTNTDGAVTGYFRATGAGAHVISASAAGVTLDETVTITVKPAAPDDEASEVTVPDGTAGAVTVIAIRLRDQFGNRVTGAHSKLDVSVSGANSKGSLSVSEGDDAEYTARYTPTKTGTDLVHVSYSGDPLGGPYPSVVSAGPAVPSLTAADVDPEATLVSQNVDVTVEVRDALGNPTRRAGEQVTVVASKGGRSDGVPVAYNPSTGKYTGSFRPWEFGEYAVSIAVNGAVIPGSPFETVMRAF